MYKHVVCFKLAEPTEELCRQTKEILLSMRENVPMVRSVSVPLPPKSDSRPSHRSYDIILEVVLDGQEALDAYQNDLYHVNVVKKHMHAVSCASVTVDCFID